MIKNTLWKDFKYVCLDFILQIEKTILPWRRNSLCVDFSHWVHNGQDYCKTLHKKAWLLRKPVFINSRKLQPVNDCTVKCMIHNSVTTQIIYVSVYQHPKLIYENKWCQRSVPEWPLIENTHLLKYIKTNIYVNIPMNYSWKIQSMKSIFLDCMWAQRIVVFVRGDTIQYNICHRPSVLHLCQIISEMS